MLEHVDIFEQRVFGVFDALKKKVAVSIQPLAYHVGRFRLILLEAVKNKCRLQLGTSFWCEHKISNSCKACSFFQMDLEDVSSL
jgi:hypothetical protein